MPKFLENKLKSEAAKKGMTGRKEAQYVYGAMNDMGAMHGNKETPKGAAMERKHDAKMRGEAHEYDHKRLKQPVRSRYSR